MCGGMRTGDGTTTFDVDGCRGFGSHHERAFDQTALLHNEVLDWLLHIVHLKHGAIIGDDLTLIGKLSAGLGIERRAVENDLHGCRRTHSRHRTDTLKHDAKHAAAGGDLRVSEELDWLMQLVLEVVVFAQIDIVTLLQGILTGSGLLLVHELAELRFVDLDPCSCAISSVSSIGKP